MKLRRLIALFAAAMLAAVSLSACQASNETATNENDEAAYVTPAGSTVEAEPEEEPEIVAEVNGSFVTADDLSYYIYAVANNYYYEIEGYDADVDFDGYDWDMEYNGGTLSDAIKTTALNEAIGNLVTSQKIDQVLTGDDAWTEEDDEDTISTVDEYVEEYGEDDFNLMARSMGISDAEQYKRVYSVAIKTQAVQNAVEEDVSAYVADSIDLSQYKDENYCTAKHILLMVDDYDDSAYDDETAAALADELYQRIMNGEDFDTLIEEYSDDPGQTETGYTFGKGEMVEEFEDAAFALNIGEVSAPVRSDYGYHIIKREAGFYEVRNLWVAVSDVTIDEDVLASVSVKDVMDDVVKATAELYEQEED